MVIINIWKSKKRQATHCVICGGNNGSRCQYAPTKAMKMCMDAVAKKVRV